MMILCYDSFHNQKYFAIYFPQLFYLLLLFFLASLCFPRVKLISHFLSAFLLNANPHYQLSTLNFAQHLLAFVIFLYFLLLLFQEWWQIDKNPHYQLFTLNAARLVFICISIFVNFSSSVFWFIVSSPPFLNPSSFFATNPPIIDHPIQLICIWFFICMSTYKEKRHSRVICYFEKYFPIKALNHHTAQRDEA